MRDGKLHSQKDQIGQWRKLRFGDLVSLRNGLNFDRAAAGQAIKVAGVGAFLQRAKLDDFSDAKTVRVRGNLSPDFLLRDGDLLFVRSNGSKELVGRCAMVFPGRERVSFSGFTIRARPITDIVDGSYLLAVARSELFRRELYEKGAGSSITNLSQELLEEVELLVPPLPEQRRIAQALDAWDQAIVQIERLISAKLQLRQWFIAELLTGRVRLPSFFDQWRSGRLCDFLYEHGSRGSGHEPVFSVSVHKGLVDQIIHLGRSFAAADTGKYNRVLPGDIVYTKSPTGDFPLGVIKQSRIDRDVIVSPLYAVFTPESRSVGVLIDAYFESPAFTERYLRPLVQKGPKNTMAIANRQFLSGAFQLPADIAEVEALAKLMDQSRSELITLDNHLGHLRTQKLGLMQKLLTGEWRLGGPVAEVAA